MNVESPISDVKLARLMFCAAGLLGIAFGIQMLAAWKTYHHVDPTAGVWTAAALDAREGILYRPIESPIGYGGSRYAPLHIVLHAALIRLGTGPVAGGYLLDLLGILLVIGGAYALLRQLQIAGVRDTCSREFPPPLVLRGRAGVGVERRLPNETPTLTLPRSTGGGEEGGLRNVPHTQIAALSAAAFAGFILAAYCYSTTAAGLKGDLLPAGLNLWGLAAAVAAQRHKSTSMLAAAAICFVLAMTAKLTSIFGVAAASLWLFSRKDWRNAILLVAVWLIGIAMAAMATQWASDDRAFGIFRLCAAGGGGLGQLLHGPRRMLADAIHNDRIFVCFWLLAAGLIGLARQWTSLPVILFTLTTLGTMAIYGSPGTNCNHLVDLQAAAVLVIAASFPSCPWGRSGAIAATAIVLFSIVYSGIKTVGILRESRHGQMMAALAEADRSTVIGPLLSENPILPIIQGQRPYMLDSFMFRTVWMRDPKIADRFWSDLSHRYFRAVILAAPPWDPTRSGNAGNFGPGFIDSLERNYKLAGHHGEYWVYLPGRF